MKKEKMREGRSNAREKRGDPVKFCIKTRRRLAVLKGDKQTRRKRKRSDLEEGGLERKGGRKGIQIGKERRSGRNSKRHAPKTSLGREEDCI